MAATLRPIEERDSKGNTIRLNPTITFKQDRQIRKVKGRHDWDLIDNPDYHEPISVQVQNGALVFFRGTPETSQSRQHAKQISQTEVEKIAPYVIENLKRNPVRVREQRPMVYEVKVASVDETDVVGAVEQVLAPGTTEVTVEPAHLELDPNKVRQAQASA